MVEWVKTHPLNRLNLRTMAYPDTAAADSPDDIQSNPRLLVVDDQASNIQAMYQALDGDYQVLMATSGSQALSICKEAAPDLVLLDVGMPELDGFEVCRQLKADPSTRGIPVILVTAHTDPAQETHALSVGAVDVIAKPINPAIVRARVKTQLTLRFQSDLLRKLVFLDGLSGVYNRRYFDQQLPIEWARSSRNNSHLSLLMVDVDFFKSYNDRYGHQAGDDCLRRIASTIKVCLKRPADLVARYGGEEFACLLPDTAHTDALELAKEVEARIRSLRIKHEHSAVDSFSTVSLGVSTRSPASQGNIATWVGVADAQLALAKQTGRGRVCGQVF
jgi:diguanylate cyclase (GGDEF)-like protein